MLLCSNVRCVCFVNLAHIHHMLERVRQGVSFSEALIGAGMLYH